MEQHSTLPGFIWINPDSQQLDNWCNCVLVIIITCEALYPEINSDVIKCKPSSCGGTEKKLTWQKKLRKGDGYGPQISEQQFLRGTLGVNLPPAIFLRVSGLIIINIACLYMQFNEALIPRKTRFWTLFKKANNGAFLALICLLPWRMYSFYKQKPWKRTGVC